MNWQNFRAVKCDFLTIFLFFRPRVCNLAYDFAPARVLHTLIYMYEKTRGIVLHVIKYSDKNSIAHVYTDTHGRMAFLLPQGATRAARMRNAMFMPLSVIEFEACITAGREIATFRDCKSLLPLSSLYAEPAKSAVAMFMSELLARTVQESEGNDPLFRFIVGSVRLLNSMERGVANFHICFLYHLGAFIGIEPDTATYREGYWFDMDNGIFTQSHPMHSHVLAPKEAAVIKLLSRMTFANMHLFKFNRVQRNEVLDIALSYYKLHNSTIGAMKSPEILRQVFG